MQIVCILRDCSTFLQAFGLHDHGSEEDGHAHESEEEGEGKTVLWRSLVVVLGLYGFFMFEFFLHSWGGHAHAVEAHSNSEVDT